MGAIIRLFVFLNAVLLSTNVRAERQWTVGFAQGTFEAIVRNDSGSSFNVFCPSGQIETNAGFFFDSQKLRISKQKLQNVEILLRIDGLDHEYFTECRPGQCSWKSFNYRADDRFSKNVDQIRRARSFSVVVPSLKIRENFSVKGAGRALKDALVGCKS